MADKTLSKPSAFQDVFARKPGVDKSGTHYCAGCGHGVAHKLIAEAVADFGLKDRAIIVAPVGCSVFLYYYFDFCAVSVPHGRAPAALTGISRVHPEAICISYQGDGDLAAIGLAEIIHAANRGERMAVFFVNNAIYGMTGGQMAPTTLVNMKTSTSPFGRQVEGEGHPMRMCEMIAGLESPVYVERVAVDSPQATMKARAAIRKALKIQMERKGFAFVEILSPCPTQWRVAPDQAGEWIRENMYPVFKLGVYRDKVQETDPRPAPPESLSAREVYALLTGEKDSGKAETAQTDSNNGRHSKSPEAPAIDSICCKLAGFGGQGVLTLGVLVAQAGMNADYHVTWLPSYGPESRGGTANSSVILSREEIGSPVVNDIDVLLAMNVPSLERFLPQMNRGGLVIYNSSIVQEEIEKRDGVKIVGVPAMDLAQTAGDVRAANVVLLGAYSALTGLFTNADLDYALSTSFPKPKAAEINRKAFAAGVEHVKGKEEGARI
ncbi:2-oxoacid:acceptor oxidoreductase family protein [bacterium]|nr:2-oxoacid:acceptor oxidoreductase family protein [bacterium]